MARKKQLTPRQLKFFGKIHFKLRQLSLSKDATDYQRASEIFKILKRNKVL